MPLDDLTQEMIVVINNLEKTTLYTGSEAAATKYDPKLFPEEYRTLGRKIWRVVNERKESSDLGSWPDNCECWDNGLPRHDRGKRAKITLLPGEDSPRWQGNTLLTALNEKEKQFLYIHRLTIHLSDYACERIDELPNIESESIPEKKSDSISHPEKVGFSLTIKLSNDEVTHCAEGFLRRGHFLSSIDDEVKSENDTNSNHKNIESKDTRGMRGGINSGKVSVLLMICLALGLFNYPYDQEVDSVAIKDTEISRLELDLEEFADYILQQSDVRVTYNPQRLTVTERLALQKKREQENSLGDPGLGFIAVDESITHLPLMAKFTYVTMAPGN